MRVSMARAFILRAVVVREALTAVSPCLMVVLNAALGLLFWFLHGFKIRGTLCYLQGVPEISIRRGN